MNKYKKIWIHLCVFLIILLSSLYGYLKYPNFFSLFENKLNDVMFLARGEKKADTNIIIIDIDEKSIQQLGQWPWSRNKVAKILQNLSDNGVGMVGLDVVFAEADDSSPKLVLKKLGIIDKKAEDYDAILANTIAQTPTLVGYVFALRDDGLKQDTAPKSSVIFIQRNKPKKDFLVQAYRAILNIPLIEDAAYGSGYFNTIPDEDGVVRSIPMVISYNGLLYPSLSLEMMRVALGEKKVYINYEKEGVESIEIGDLTIPTDRFGRMIINYRGTHHKYKYISAYDIYTNTIDPKEIEGKIALLGTSAAGLLDLRSTPFDSVYPGVEVHATAIDNMLNKDFLAMPSWITGADVIDILLTLIIAFFLLLIPSALASFVFLTLFLLLLVYGHYYLMIDRGLLVNTLFPFLGVSILFLVGESINYFFETRQKERIRKKFATKVSPAVVKELIDRADEYTFDVQEKEITIFFSDIRGFTTISEQLGNAKELIQLLNFYMTPMVDIITKYKGTVDKFIGDAIMAYWNAPVDVKNHPDQALRSAIEQILRLQKLNIELTNKHRPNINIGIGINTGLSVVGEMGSYGRSDYTCIGDTVNLASRLEGLCKPYGSRIIISEFTCKRLKSQEYLLRELDIVQVKGKIEAVTIYECMGNKTDTWVKFNKNDSTLYMQALQLYRDAQFDKALQIFTQLHAVEDQKLYALYKERCEYYIKNGAENFNGIFTFITK